MSCVIEIDATWIKSHILIKPRYVSLTSNSYLMWFQDLNVFYILHVIWQRLGYIDNSARVFWYILESKTIFLALIYVFSLNEVKTVML